MKSVSTITFGITKSDSGTLSTGYFQKQDGITT